MNRTPRLLTCLSCLVLLAGCGGGGDDSKQTDAESRGGDTPKAKPVDACTLLDKAAVAEAIGEDISKVEGQETPDGASTCSWFGVDDGSLQQKGITLIAAADNGKERWDAHRDLMGEAQPVSGVGEQAVTADEVVAAYEGDAFVVASPLYAESGVEASQVQAMATDALDAMQ